MVAAFATVALLTLLPFFRIGLTTGDDLQYFITSHNSWKGWLYDASVYAIGAGRFYFLITKYFYYVPYLIDNFTYTKIVQYVTLATCYGAFAYLVLRMFKSQRLALLSLLLLIFNTAVTSQDHIPNISYPFYFTFSSIIFMMAVIEYINYCEKGHFWRLAVASILCFVTYLFYETYLLFSLLFFAAIVVRHFREEGYSAFHNRKIWIEFTPFAVVILIYMFCYMGFRIYIRCAYPEATLYDGSRFDVSQFNIHNFFRVIERCTRIALPGQTYFYYKDIIDDTSLLPSGYYHGIFNIFTQASAIVWINAILQTVMLWWLTKGQSLQRLSWTKIALGIVMSISVAYGAHALIAITPKYNIEWSSWIRGYVTSFYSIMALMLSLALIVAASIKALKKQWWNRLVRGFWCIVMLCFSILIGYSNEHISREWAKSQDRLRTIDLIANAGFFDSLPDNALLYTQSLHNTPGICFGYQESFREMEDYINLRAKRNFSASAEWEKIKTQKEQAPERPVYYVHAAASQKNGDILVAIANITDSILTIPDSLIASNADVFYYSPTKQFTLFYAANDSIQSITYYSDDVHRPLSHIKIQSDGIIPSSITVSNIPLSYD